MAAELYFLLILAKFCLVLAGSGLIFARSGLIFAKSGLILARSGFGCQASAVFNSSTDFFKAIALKMLNLFLLIFKAIIFNPSNILILDLLKYKLAPFWLSILSNNRFIFNSETKRQLAKTTI